MQRESFTAALVDMLTASAQLAVRADERNEDLDETMHGLVADLTEEQLGDAATAVLLLTGTFARLAAALGDRLAEPGDLGGQGVRGRAGEALTDVAGCFDQASDIVDRLDFMPTPLRLPAAVSGEPPEFVVALRGATEMLSMYNCGDYLRHLVAGMDTEGVGQAGSAMRGLLLAVAASADALRWNEPDEATAAVYAGLTDALRDARDAHLQAAGPGR